MSPQKTDKADRPGGGVAVYILDSCLLKSRSDLKIRGLEAVWVE